MTILVNETVDSFLFFYGIFKQMLLDYLLKVFSFRGYSVGALAAANLLLNLSLVCTAFITFLYLCACVLPCSSTVLLISIWRVRHIATDELFAGV